MKTLLVATLLAATCLGQEFNPPPDANLPSTYYAQILFQDGGLVQWGISNLGPNLDGGELWIQRKNPQEQYRYATLQAVGWFYPYPPADWLTNSTFKCTAYQDEYNFAYAKARGWLYCLSSPNQAIIQIVYINPADPVTIDAANYYYNQYGAGR